MPNDATVCVRPRVSPERAHVVRPFRSLYRQGIITIVALTTPVFAVLYWLGIHSGTWPLVLALHVFVLVITALIVLGSLAVAIQFSADGVSERGFLGRTRHTPADTIEGVLVLEMYRTSALDTQPQLFIYGTDGKVLLRMRGMFWSRSAMDLVADTVAAPVEIVDSTVTLAELRRTRPELLYWFERFPRFGFSTARVRAILPAQPPR